MRSLLFISLIMNCESTPFLDNFNIWVDTFHIQFESKHQFYDTLRKWTINDEYIDTINQQYKSYTLGHNQFSGMDEYDFSNYVNAINYSFAYKININNEINNQINNEINNQTIPISVDWRDKNAVTPVKDQGQCGSCWSFSTTGSLEGIYAIQTDNLVSFSEQQLVDCDNFRHGGKDHGCNGGLMDNAFSWINKNGGLCTEESYPYIGETEKCQTMCDIVPKSQIQSWVDVPSSDQALMASIAQQPVSIAIEADQIDFQLYKSGVLTSNCGTTLDHGVLVVGYGTENGEDYYLVKNSWGTSWGDQGYIKLGRGPQYNAGDGQCGILLQASYPIL